MIVREGALLEDIGSATAETDGNGEPAMHRHLPWVICQKDLNSVSSAITAKKIEPQVLKTFCAVRAAANAQLPATKHNDGDAIQDIQLT